ncbi:MAG: NAD(P)-binding protein [Paracoccaceae bacterium]
MDDDRLKRATSIKDSYELFDGIYLLGSLQSGVTIYNQQVRAHNLIWALRRLADESGIEPSSGAVVGGGIGGLTTTACLHSMFPEADVTLFEKQWELCPLQLGSDNRWVHPSIYEWPEPGSRSPSSGLPLLNWSEGRASDVARQVISHFSNLVSAFQRAPGLYLGTRHLKVEHSNRVVEWLGTSTELRNGFLSYLSASGSKKKFDVIVLATGFGVERTSPVSEAGSYWQNERLAQPSFDGRRTNYLVSGYGDGALVDLARLRISRFRQDTIVYELFADQLDIDEVELCELKNKIAADPQRAFDGLSGVFDGPFAHVVEKVRQRLRSDTSVIMHLSGSPQQRKTSISDVFSGNASFLNKVLFFALYRAGGFTPCFDSLEEAVTDYGIEPRCVLVRHGTDPVEVLKRTFHDPRAVDDAVCKMRTNEVQSEERCWAPGSFRTS